MRLRIYLLRWRLRVWADKLAAALAARAPHRLRYRLVIDAWAKATTGRYGTTDPVTLTVDELVRRIEQRASERERH